MCSPGCCPPQDWAWCWRGESLRCLCKDRQRGLPRHAKLQAQNAACPWSARGCLCRVAALRFTSYSQLEYITAAMLARHVKPGGARVLQVPCPGCAVLCWQDSKR
jgi:hypothetical protein